jgi:hypothetical protein
VHPACRCRATHAISRLDQQPVGAGLWLCLHSGVHARWEGKSILGGLWVSLPRCGRFRVFDSPGTLTGRQELGGCGWVTDGCGVSTAETELG